MRASNWPRSVWSWDIWLLSKSELCGTADIALLNAALPWDNVDVTTSSRTWLINWSPLHADSWFSVKFRKVSPLTRCPVCTLFITNGPEISVLKHWSWSSVSFPSKSRSESEAGRFSVYTLSSALHFAAASTEVWAILAMKLGTVPSPTSLDQLISPYTKIAYRLGFPPTQHQRQSGHHLGPFLYPNLASLSWA